MQPKGVAVFKKMLEDKKAISKHLHAGGTFTEFSSQRGLHSRAYQRRHETPMLAYTLKTNAPIA